MFDDYNEYFAYTKQIEAELHAYEAHIEKEAQYQEELEDGLLFQYEGGY